MNAILPKDLNLTTQYGNLFMSLPPVATAFFHQESSSSQSNPKELSSSHQLLWLQRCFEKRRELILHNRRNTRDKLLNKRRGVHADISATVLKPESPKATTLVCIATSQSEQTVTSQTAQNENDNAEANLLEAPRVNFYPRYLWRRNDKQKAKEPPSKNWLSCILRENQRLIIIHGKKIRALNQASVLLLANSMTCS